MCDCRKDHPQFGCGHSRCRCHDYDTEREMIRSKLMEGLIGDHQYTYSNNPEFHAQIELMAKTIPVIVDTLAHDAIRTDNSLELLRQKLTGTSIQGLPL